MKLTKVVELPIDTIGQRIKAIRFIMSLNQRDLAKLCNKSQGQINLWESGKIKPGIKQIQNISEKTETNPSWLAFGLGEMKDES